MENDIIKIFKVKDPSWLKEYINYSKERKYIPTGYMELDNLIDGFYPGCLYLIGAWTGVGKTTLILNLLVNLKNVRQLVFTTEVTASAYLEKMLSRLSGIEYKFIRQNTSLIHNDLIPILNEFDINIVDKYKPEVKDIRYCLDRIKPQIIYFDYFQNVGTNPFIINKYVEYTKKVEEIFNLDREYNIPIVLASQLKRPTGDSANKRPEIWDMKETGKLEESAHVAMLLSKSPNGLFIDVVKNRNGPVGEFELKGEWSINKLG